MSDVNGPAEGTPDTTPTEATAFPEVAPLPVEPAPPAAAAPATGRSHTRTILEVVGGVVAAGLIVVAGVFGFVVGHATGSDRDARGVGHSDGQGFGPDAGGPFGQGPQGRGFGSGDGQGRGHGMRGGDGDGQPMGPGMGMGLGQGFGNGQDPRGIDPDGDNWTGQNQQPLPQDQTLPQGQAVPVPTPQG